MIFSNKIATIVLTAKKRSHFIRKNESGSGRLKKLRSSWVQRKSLNSILTYYLLQLEIMELWDVMTSPTLFWIHSLVAVRICELQDEVDLDEIRELFELWILEVSLLLILVPVDLPVDVKPCEFIFLRIYEINLILCFHL